MGLDMFLNAKRFIWNNEADLAVTVARLFPELKERQVREVIVEAIYWRKANAIHKWFVDNVQNGEDNCCNYHVSREQLEKLRTLIQEALESSDASKLPACSGFFFGSTDINSDYWNELKDTVTELDKILAEFDDKWDFEYTSSWQTYHEQLQIDAAIQRCALGCCSINTLAENSASTPPEEKVVYSLQAFF